MTRDERRTAHLLFAGELATGELRPEDLDTPEVAAAVAVGRIPSLPGRVLQRVAMKRGRLTYGDHVVAPAMAARRALLGDAAGGPPRVLLRFDEFPNYAAVDHPETFDTAAFAGFHAVLRDAGAPYLVAVLPRVSSDPLNPKASGSRPWTDDEREMLVTLRHDGVAFGLHALDHRTRHASPRRRSELVGLRPAALARRLDEGQAALRELALHAPVFVAPYNRFSWQQYAELARRFDVVTGGPESVPLMGFHPPAQWRGEAVYLPAYPPLYGTAAEVAGAVADLADRGAALWVPAVLHLEAELRDGFRGLRRLADLLGAGLGRPWEELLAAIELSRTA